MKKKHLEVSTLTTSVPKIMITCYTVPEIWCARDVIVIIHFGLIFAFLLPLPLPNSPKNENFKTMEKTPGYIIILQNCTKNHDHMLYCSWDVVHDRCNCCFSFWAIFCPFTSPFPLNSPKNENFKKMKKGKKTPADIILNKCTKNYDQMPYCSWDMVCDGCNYFFILG